MTILQVVTQELKLLPSCGSTKVFQDCHACQDERAWGAVWWRFPCIRPGSVYLVSTYIPSASTWLLGHSQLQGSLGTVSQLQPQEEEGRETRSGE